MSFFFFFNDTATTDIYTYRHTLSLPDALPIYYRPRSTIREVVKALGFSEDVTARLADTSWGSWGDDVPTRRLVEAGLEPYNGEVERLHRFLRVLLEAPRHLSPHVGGLVLTGGRLDEPVLINTAASEELTSIVWANIVIHTTR